MTGRHIHFEANRKTALRSPRRVKADIATSGSDVRFGADSEEKQEPVSDIDAAVVDSLKVLDPNRPIREADIR